MKKVLNRLTVLLIAAVFAVTLTACGSKKNEDPERDSSVTSQTSEPANEDSKPETAPSSDPQPESSVPPESDASSEPEEGELVVYDPETDSTTSEVIPAEDDLDAALVKALNEALSFDGHEIKVNSITVENGGLTIDLAEDSMPLVGVGSGGEAACLKSIAVTFLKNYPEAELVYFTVDGGIYSSGHIEFAPGEPYMDRSMMD